MAEEHTKPKAVPDPDAELRAEIKRRHKARGWSVTKLAREAKVSTKTINRIENGTDYAGAGSIAKVAAALGIDGYGRDGDPPLSTATPEEISAHIYRLLVEAEDNKGMIEKIRGFIPADILERANAYDPHHPKPGQPARPKSGGHMDESGS